MDPQLNREAVRSTLQELEASLPHDACRTCECLQGFLTQLQLDAPEDAGALIRPWLAARSQVHGCLGCDPCPPGERFADYLRTGDKPAAVPILLMQSDFSAMMRS
jgi:hypothetical protein